MSETETILETESLTKSFGGLVAVDDVSVGVTRGEITGLIGPNGAGKSTLFNLVTGFLRPDAGTVRFKGADITSQRPPERADGGLVRTFQTTRELSGMSVMDNMLLAAQDNPGENVVPTLVRWGEVSSYEEQRREQARDLLEFLDLWELREEYAGNLSGGQRKLLELGRVLMADPDALLLDEPMAGVNPDLTDQLLDRIQYLQAEEGMTFLIVEHDIETIMTISQTVVGMHDGEILAEGTPSEVRQDEEMIEAYLGGDV